MYVFKIYQLKSHLEDDDFTFNTKAHNVEMVELQSSNCHYDNLMYMSVIINLLMTVMPPKILRQGQSIVIVRLRGGCGAGQVMGGGNKLWSTFFNNKISHG